MRPCLARYLLPIQHFSPLDTPEPCLANIVVLIDSGLNICYAFCGSDCFLTSVTGTNIWLIISSEHYNVVFSIMRIVIIQMIKIVLRFSEIFL